MAVALKLQTLELPADKRQRLDELRAASAPTTALSSQHRASNVPLPSRSWSICGRSCLDSSRPSATESRASLLLAQARALVAAGGAVVVPVVTKVGAKISDRAPHASRRQHATLSVVDLPELTTDRLNVLMRGDGKTAPRVDGSAPTTSTTCRSR